MAGSLKEMLAAANAAVPKISPADARKAMESEGALIVDVRDAPELEANGKIPGALHVSRGMLEFRADPESPYHNKEFAKDRTIILHCASGGRSALAGKVLKDFGYTKVFNLGAFKDWAESGCPVEKPGSKSA
jgi:rhodanese-related sulfurtransferase